MSDGPWKSLPLRPQWKEVAKRAENGVFTLEERREAGEAALTKEADELPLKAVFRTVDGHGGLFGLAETVETLLQDHPGSKSVHTFLTCLSDLEADPSSGRDIMESAVADMLDECLLDNWRSIEEHYLRRDPILWERVEPRFNAVRESIDTRGLACRIVADSGSSGQAHRPPKRSGLDEGPQL